MMAWEHVYKHDELTLADCIISLLLCDQKHLFLKYASQKPAIIHMHWSFHVRECLEYYIFIISRLVYDCSVGEKMAKLQSFSCSWLLIDNLNATAKKQYSLWSWHSPHAY